MMMKHETFNDLMLDELKDIYDAEQQLTEALPKMAKAAKSSELKQGFETHLRQTKDHVARVEQIFEMLGEQPKRKTCKAMKGLIAEGQEMIDDHDRSPLLDAGLIGAAQRVEHYEIAAYGTLRAFAETLGHQDVIDVIEQTLQEEKQTDETLTQIAMEVNRQAASDAMTGTGSSRDNTNRSPVR
jgi:ferritin-like metal-binding protein YciE